MRGFPKTLQKQCFDPKTTILAKKSLDFSARIVRYMQLRKTIVPLCRIQ